MLRSISLRPAPRKVAVYDARGPEWITEAWAGGLGAYPAQANTPANREAKWSWLGSVSPR
jgi:hypothetical protein